MTTRKQRAEQAAAESDLARADSRRQREEAAALRAESRQARHQAETLIDEHHTLLDAAVALIAEALERRRIAVREPVAARFQTDEHGSTGIEVTVRLEDPATAGAARRAIDERVGGEVRLDNVILG